MPKIDEYEIEVLSAFEKGKFKSVATKAELAKFKVAAQATAGQCAVPFFRLFLLSIALTSCAAGPGGGGAYDPDAQETLGRIVERRDSGTTTRLAGRGVLIPVGGLFIPIPLDRGTSSMSVFAHTIALDDGRRLVVYSWYPEHQVGNCVKLFESSRPDYPRMINSSGCKP